MGMPVRKNVKHVLGQERSSKCTTYSSVAFDPTGALVGTAATWSRDVGLWNADTGQQIRVLEGHEGCINDVTFSPDGKKLASGSDDKTVRVWDVATGGVLFQFAVPDETQAVAFSRDGRMLAAGSRRHEGGCGFVTLVEAATGNKIGDVWYMPAGPNALAFSPDGAYLVCAGGDERNRVGIWDVSQEEQVESKSSGWSLWVEDVAFCPTGKCIASAQSTAAFVWRLGSGEPLHTLEAKPEGTLPDDQVQCVAFTPGGEFLATTGHDGAVRLWNWQTGKLLVTYQLIPKEREDGYGSLISEIEFSPDGCYVATANGNGTYYIAQVAQRRRARRG